MPYLPAFFNLNMSTSFSILLVYFLVVTTEGCMKMIPPDEAYIPSTLAPTSATEEPEVRSFKRRFDGSLHTL